MLVELSGEREVTTVAGDGVAGDTDGTVADARFPCSKLTSPKYPPPPSAQMNLADARSSFASVRFERAAARVIAS